MIFFYFLPFLILIFSLFSGEFLLQYRNRKALFVQARNVHLDLLQTNRTQIENKDTV